MRQSRLFSIPAFSPLSFPFSVVYIDLEVFFINQCLVLQQMDEATDAVLTVDVNSHEIASGSADGSARVYSIRNGKLTDGKLIILQFGLYNQFYLGRIHCLFSVEFE